MSWSYFTDTPDVISIIQYLCGETIWVAVGTPSTRLKRILAGREAAGRRRRIKTAFCLCSIILEYSTVLVQHQQFALSSFSFPETLL